MVNEDSESVMIVFKKTKNGKWAPTDCEKWRTIQSQIISLMFDKDVIISPNQRYGLPEKLESMKNMVVENVPVPSDEDPYPKTREEENLLMREMMATEPVYHPASYQRALQSKQEVIWQSLSKVTVKEAVAQWIETIQNPCTKKSYCIAMGELVDRGFLIEDWYLQAFSLYSPDLIIDRIKTAPVFIKDKNGNKTQEQWSIRTREARISCFLAFTRYLSRKTEGVIRRGIPSREGIEKTFSAKPRRVKTDAMTRSQVLRFLEELHQINSRDAMIARLCLHGGKRINEVLSLETAQINYEKRQIEFKQSKSRFSDDITVISFERETPYALLQELKAYIGDRKGVVFVTANGKSIQKNQVDRNFAKAGSRAEIPFRTSPHNLRATFVTLHKEAGFSDSLIMKATGHSSSEMVHRYDKSDIADNVTRKASLF